MTKERLSERQEAILALLQIAVAEMSRHMERMAELKKDVDTLEAEALEIAADMKKLANDN